LSARSGSKVQEKRDLSYRGGSATKKKRDKHGGVEEGFTLDKTLEKGEKKVGGRDHLSSKKLV